MYTIYLTRHGQKDNTFIESQELHFSRKLTTIGEKQAELLGKELADKGIEQLYSSDMDRAFQTAQIANTYIKAKEIIQDPRLREADPCTIHTHPDRGEFVTQCWLDWNYVPPYGESYNQAKARFTEFIDEIASKPPKNPVLIVTHGRILRLFLSKQILKLPHGDELMKTTPNCTDLTQLNFQANRNFEMIKYDDNSYLPEELKSN